MTTINQFLTDTKSYTTKSAEGELEATINTGGALLNKFKTDPWGTISNPRKAGTESINEGVDKTIKNRISNTVTPTYVDKELDKLLTQEEYAPLAPTITRLRGDQNFNRGLLNTIRTGVYDAFARRDSEGNLLPWDDVSRKALEDAAKNGIPEDKMSLIRNGVADFIFNNLVSEDNTNDSRLLDTFTDIVGAANPANAKAIQNLRKADPQLGNNLIKIIKPQIRAAYGKHGISAFSGQNKEDLITAITPGVTGALQDSALLAQDIFPDEEVKPGWSESQHADLNYFGKANDYAEKNTILPYDHSLDPWYDDENDTKSNRVMIGAFNTFANDDEKGIQMLETLRRMPMDLEKRKQSALYRTSEGFANTLRLLGRDAEANEVMAGAEALIEQAGEYGNSPIDTATMYYNYVKPRAQKAWNSFKENFKNSPVFNEAAKKQIGQNWTQDELAKRQAAWNAISQKRQNNILEDSYYGFFKDPNMQRAARYAAPWLTYGPLLASIGSIFGNNSLWPLVLFGGLGSGLFGYGAKPWFNMSDDTLGTIDNISSTMNQPLGMLGGFLPKGMKPSFNSLLGIKNTEERTPEPTIPPATSETPSSPSLEPMPEPEFPPSVAHPTALSKPKSNNQPFNTNNQYAGYMKPRFSPTGNNAYQDPFSPASSGYVVNPYNNPANVGIQRLS